MLPLSLRTLISKADVGVLNIVQTISP